MHLISSGPTKIRLEHAPAAGGGTHAAVLLLHGAGGNLDWWLPKLLPIASELKAHVFAPHYLDRTGHTRADPHVIADGASVPLWLEAVADTLQFVARRTDVDASRIAVVGISLGAFLATALAASCREVHLRALVDISGGLVEPWASQAGVAFPPTLILHGAQDSTVPVSHASGLDDLLTRLGVEHEIEIFPDQGHWLMPGAQKEALRKLGAFLARHLSVPPQPGP